MRKWNKLGWCSVALAVSTAVYAEVAGAAAVPVENYVNQGFSPSDAAPLSTGVVYTNSIQQLSYSSSDVSGAAIGDPANLDSKIEVSASNGESISGYSSVRRWQILTTTGDATTATLYADIAFYGSFQSTGNGTASFTHALYFRPSPETTGSVVLVINGTDNNDIPTGGTAPPACSFSLTGSVTDLCFANNDLHLVDQVIRSQELLVTLGTPFALTLSLNATAAANVGGGLAMVDFLDPALEGLWIKLGDEIVPLSAAEGYALAVIPEPATLLLFAMGLAGLGAVRRKKLAA
jgi:hypothetical protein